MSDSYLRTVVGPDRWRRIESECKEQVSEGKWRRKSVTTVVEVKETRLECGHWDSAVSCVGKRRVLCVHCMSQDHSSKA